MLFSNPRVLPALLFFIGVAIIFMRGQELEQMKNWHPEDLETAVELNLALDLARSGHAAPLSADEREAREAAIRQELIETFVEPKQRMETEYRQGFWMAGAGLFLMALVMLLQQRGILKKS